MRTTLEGLTTAPAPEPAVRPTVSWRAVALPTEHGGWGMLGEPLLLGLLLAPSLPGAGIAVAAVAAFLCRHPLKLALADRRKRVRYARTAIAECCVAAYGLVAVVGLMLAVWKAGVWVCLPLGLAAPLALLQLSYDARHQGRRLAPELLGGIALGSVAPAVMLAGGWSPATAWSVWGIVAAKAVSSVLYVRARLRLDRGQRTGLRPAWSSHVFGVAAALGSAALGWVPWLTPLAFAALLGRAVYGLSPLRRPLRPQALGAQEMALGFLTTLLLALGYAVGP